MLDRADALCKDAPRSFEHAKPTRADAALPASGFVFCCFNASHKITPTMFDVWMGLLKALEESVLWLLGSNPAVERNLRHEAERRGVAPSRLIFAPRVSRPPYLARYQLADLFLDTFPFNAGATASDALAERRTILARNRVTCPLFDTDRFCRALAAAYATMWQRAQRAQPAESFAVELVPRQRQPRQTCV